MRLVWLLPVIITALAINCGGTAGDIEPLPTKGGIPTDFAKPPEVMMRLAGQSQSGSLGSYTWENVQADSFGIYAPAEAVSVVAGDEVEFDISGGAPRQVSLLVYRPLSPPTESSDGIVGWLFGPEAMNLATVKRQELRVDNQPKYRVDLPPGKYLLSLLVWWEEGQAGYGFHVDVTE